MPELTWGRMKEIYDGNSDAAPIKWSFLRCLPDFDSMILLTFSEKYEEGFRDGYEKAMTEIKKGVE